ncbi:transcription termination factor 2 [Condylostylus longicornis]|uniref:transcription termination factor 2 n=1 Tax=Condylostylus longicornis TaxID=2530218 RepID=UPI00244DA1F4|nr:transcription termination factor 2 [Condylostylus longicornis]
MSSNKSFSQYRDIETSDESDEYVDASYNGNSTESETEVDGNLSLEIPQTDSEDLTSNDEDTLSKKKSGVSGTDSNDDEIEERKSSPLTKTTEELISSDEEILPTKRKNVRRVESSDEEIEERRAIYSPRTRRSIHGFRISKSSSEEEEDEKLSPNSSEIENNFPSRNSSAEVEEKLSSSNCSSEAHDQSADKQYSNKLNTPSFANSTRNENTKTQDTGVSEISKFSKIYDSKSVVSTPADQTKEDISLHFDSSITNKLSSTMSDPQKNERVPISPSNNKTEKSIEIMENKNDVIILDSSEESVSLVTSTPDVLSEDKKKIVQPKITAALNNTPTTTRSKTRFSHPQFVSKEFLSREIRKLDELRTELKTCEKLLKVNVNLPDGGAKMRDRIEKCKIQIKKHANYVSNLVVDQEEINANRSAGIDRSQNDPSRDSSNSSQNSFRAPTWDELAAAVDSIKPKYTGTQGLATFAAQKTITIDRLKDIHGSLETCPDENILANNPKKLKIELMNHQKHALAWMQWREKQKPRGGILADDMGLGKTLTMISLILAQQENQNESVEKENESSDENVESEKWLSKGRKDYFYGGTLIVCPASLLQQWENEIYNRCKKNALSVAVHHGSNRDTKARILAKNDVVITTYHIISREYKTEGTIFRIKWERVIIDEAHIIRNYKAQMSLSCCGLKAKRRWALTGTPVQNKEMDLYAIMKFLKCSPFDDLGHWKKWIDNKSAGGQARLNTLMKSLLLRRTKLQLQQNDNNFNLPEKTTKLIEVILDKDEMNVYQRVMIYSQTLFSQFLHQKTERENDLNYGNTNNAPTFMQTKDPNGAFYKMHKQMAKLGGNNKEIKTFEILVLLLRLRQICCHPCLIESMLEEEDMDQTENFKEYVNVDLLKHLESLQINDKTDNSESTENFNVSHEDSIVKAAARVLKKSNPVFDKYRSSSKLNRVLELLEEILNNNSDKAIVVSQWTSLLDLLRIHLRKRGYHTVSLNGTVPVKNRNDIVNSFNDQTNKIRIMLLSLTAGGVGLNLVGANHLLLIDLHWNPQLESQAQDRIYRVGQKKPVYIYKFMVKDTIEERIKRLQDKKLEIANGVLTGVGSQGSKLTMDDLKGLFGL